MAKKLSIYVDGGSRGNPGPAGIGVVLKDGKGKAIKEFNKYSGYLKKKFAGSEEEFQLLYNKIISQMGN